MRQDDMKRYPMWLSPISKSAVWGGCRLQKEWGKTAERLPLAESWELSVRFADTNTVQNGEAKGLALSEALAQMGRDAVSADYADGGRFPLLIKWIDAALPLSVQVHPDDVHAATEGDSGKTELWYIAEAEEGASIYYGLREDISYEELCLAVLEGRTETVLKKQPVRAGECYFIPSGTVHAIGAGILIAEIQQSSELTYRLYDYNRTDKDGKRRELHVDRALEVVRLRSADEIERLRYERTSARTDECLADCRFFSVHRWEIVGERAEQTPSDRFSHLLCVAGEGSLCFEGQTYPVRRGQSIFLPADMGSYRLIGDMTLLCSQP